MTTINNDCASRECLSPPFVRWYNFFRWLVFGLLGALLLALIGRSMAYASIVAPTISGPTGTVEVDRYAVSGQGTENSLVRVMLNDEMLGETVVAADGTWSIETGTLPVGEYEAVATSFDPEGVARGDSNALLWTVAAAAAVAEVVDDTEYGPPTLDGASGGVDSAEIVLTGTGAPNTTVEVLRNGEVVGSADVGDDGAWTFTSTTDQIENEFVARGVSPDGEDIGTSNAVSLSALAAAAGLTFSGLPAIGEFAVSPDGTEDMTLATIDLSGTGQPGALVEIFANGESVGTTSVDPDETWRFTGESTVPVGDVELTARMTLPDGSELSGQPSATFTVPTMAVDVDDEETPRAALVLDVIATTGAGEATIAGSAEPGATVEITVDGDVVATVTAGDDGMWTFSGTFESGEHVVDVRDVSGNGNAVASDAFVIDGEAVEAEPEEVEESAENENDETPADAELAVESVSNVDDSPTIGTVDFGMSGTGRPGVQLVVLENGEAVGGATVQADGTWSCTCSLPPGEHQLIVQDLNDPSYSSEVITFVVENLTQLPAPPTSTEGNFTCSGTPPTGEIRGHLYIVAQCESFGLIADRLGTSVNDLLAYNPQITDTRLIYPGQILNIPSDAGCFDNNG